MYTDLTDMTDFNIREWRYSRIEVHGSPSKEPFIQKKTR
jgi:hypothetical protein